MGKGWISTVIIGFLALSGGLLTYLEKQNEVTKLKLAIPQLTKEIKEIQEENIRLQYQVQQFERPDHLLQLSMQKEYSHLKHPLGKDVLVVSVDQIGVPTGSCLAKDLLSAGDRVSR